MKEIMINALKLCLITLVAGLLLGSVYEITKEPREEQEEKTKQKAYAKVFSGSESFEEMDYDSDNLKKYLEENGYKSSVAYIDGIVKAYDSDKNVIGYVITVTDKEGYGGDIQFTLGIQNDGTINGISFLSISETAGVGMKAKEKKFLNQFQGKNVDSFEYTKNGAVTENQIDAISGATITTNAVTNGVNTGILAYKFIINNTESGGDTNE
jgi:electron transport complex protein RnfG